MRLLITRPEPDATALQILLRELGHEAVLAPMLTVRYLPTEPLDLSGVQALVFTSANGVRAFAHACKDRGLLVFAVGEATAKKARDHGFLDVRSANGDVGDLAETIVAECAPSEGSLLHVTGTVVARDLGSLLECSQFEVSRVVLYEALPAQELSEDVTGRMLAGTLDGVLFYSPRTADIFAQLIEDAELREVCKGLTGFCLSDGVAEKLSKLPFDRLDIAANPSQDALLKLLPASSH